MEIHGFACVYDFFACGGETTVEEVIKDRVVEEGRILRDDTDVVGESRV